MSHTPIIIEEATAQRTPVLRRREIGETFSGLLIRKEQRGRQRKDKVTKEMVPVMKPGGQKQAQELVLHLLVLPGSTMPAGLGDDEAIPQPGDLVRAILKGGAYGQFIEADNALKPRHVADVVGLTSTWAQAYNDDGPVGDKIHANEQIIDARMKGRNVGIYGDLTIRRAGPAEAVWVEKAEAAYWEWKNGSTPVLDQAAVDDIFAD